MRAASDLGRATLIASRSEPQAWDAWMRQHGTRRAAGADTLTFDQLYFALQAALDSLGVALAPATLVANEIALQRLVSIAQIQGKAGPQYALLAPRITTMQESLETLAGWLRAAADKR